LFSGEELVAAVRGGEVDLGAGGHDAQRVDARVAAKVVLLDLHQVDRLLFFLRRVWW